MPKKSGLYLIRDEATNKVLRVGVTKISRTTVQVGDDTTYRETYDPPVNVRSGEVLEFPDEREVSV